MAGNRSDTYALFLYPEDEQQMLNISCNHTNMSNGHAKPQGREHWDTWIVDFPHRIQPVPIPEGISQPLSGKLSGLVSVGDTKVKLNNVDIHGFAVVGEGRVYISISPVPGQAGWALMAVSPLVSTIGWLFALELQNHLNGFSITGAEFSHQAELVFSPQGQRVTIIQEAQGMDLFNHLNFSIRISGDLPSIPNGAKVHILPYKETYQYNQSAVTSSSLREYMVVSENGGSETFSYMLHQNVSFRPCEHGPWTIPDFQQVNVEHLMVMFTEGTTLRYAITNKVGPVGGELPGLELNPCSTRKHHCDPMALCLPGDGTHYHCQCAMGFQGDGRNCYDVDECAEGLSSCGPHSECVNMPGGYHCNCQTGYEFDLDSHVCVEKHRPPLTVCQQHRESLQESLSIYPGLEAFIPQCDEKGQYKLLQCLGSTGHCWCVDSRGQERVGTRTMPGTAHANCDQPAALLPRAETVCERWRLSLMTHYSGQPSSQDYMPLCDAHGNFLPVQCYGNSSFCWCVDSQGVEMLGTRSYDDVKPPCLVQPEGIAVDTVHRKLFWVDSGKDRIETSSLDGSNRKVLIDSDLVNPRAIIVDANSGTLYWTDWNRDAPKIESSSLEGHKRKVLVQAGLMLPNALTLDLDTNHLCWADAGTKKLECISPNGTERRVFQDALNYPFSLAIYNRHFYYTDWERMAYPQGARTANRRQGFTAAEARPPSLWRAANTGFCPSASDPTAGQRVQ
ncbi:nidogen-2 isoform X2 [Labeo rohita]|uniref:Nidogen-2 isoform X2 n=1 Tax=Labeo rohita TaxID=84645 RepID=A0A498N3L4_LABRO|nr:nidogen-2 isoform X2 [Labeo rohita]